MEFADLDLEAIQKHLEAVSSRSRDVAASFVYIELQTGLSACRYVRGAQSLTKRKKAWYLDFAKKALRHAEDAMWKLKMDHPEFDQMMALAERLKFELRNLQDT